MTAATPSVNQAEQAAQWLRSQLAPDAQLSADSRKLSPGDGFIAMPGLTTDGRAYIGQACVQGAAAVLFDSDGFTPPPCDVPTRGMPGLRGCAGDVGAAFYGHPSRRMTVFAVTGTNGKTTCANWLAAGASQDGQPGAAIGTLGVLRFDARGATTVEPDGGQADVVLTTPDAVGLQRTLAQLGRADTTVVAFEASSIGLEQGRMSATDIDVAVFTNLSRDHLDYHGSMDSYLSAKKMLFAWPDLDAVVVNADDNNSGAMLDAVAPGVRRFACGTQRSDLGVDAQVILGRCDPVDGGQQIELTLKRNGQPDITATVLLPVLGHFNVLNAAAVCTAWHAAGLPFDQAVERLATLQPVPGRMQALARPAQPVVVVDYAHTPDALRAALDALQPVARHRNGQLWVVFGCGGDRDAGKRPLMGRVAETGADRIVVTSDNPRSESPEDIIAQVLGGLVNPTSTSVASNVDRSAAITDAVQGADVNDVVLVAGKGHEAYQEIGGQKHDFDDWQVCQQAIAAREVSA
jgi:UDP-N-acetylmuramyl-tripeptide synthetase